MTLSSIVDKLTHISPEILRYLDRRLDEWAEWNLKKDSLQLNYPTASVQHRMMTLGCIPFERPGPKPLPVNEAAEEMEDIIRIMAKQNKSSARCATALREYYIGRERGNQERAAREMGVSERNFRGYIQDAFGWLAGWFTRDYAGRLLNVSLDKHFV